MTPAASRPMQVLVLRTGNDARSILCEALINHHGNKHWRAFSAGSHPAGPLHPVALQTLEQHRIDTADLRSKSWNEYAADSAPRMDIVITVCDHAAATCPPWPGLPMKVHWGMADPAAARKDQQADAFRTAFMTLQRRITRMIELPATLDRDLLQTELRKLAMVF